MKKKNIYFIFIIICVLICCEEKNIRKELKELLEYNYDFLSFDTLYEQFLNMGFECYASEGDLEKVLGSTFVSIFGTPIDEEKEESFSDDKLIILGFSTFSGKPPSKWYRRKIRKFLITSYGKPEVISFKGQRVPLWNFAVLEPDLPIERWELKDRYLYLNDYRKWYRNIFEIRIKMKDR
jgi:hypothetical protein